MNTYFIGNYNHHWYLPHYYWRDNGKLEIGIFEKLGKRSVIRTYDGVFDFRTRGKII